MTPRKLILIIVTLVSLSAITGAVLLGHNIYVSYQQNKEKEKILAIDPTKIKGVPPIFNRKLSTTKNVNSAADMTNFYSDLELVKQQINALP